jgi:hypothetical protein
MDASEEVFSATDGHAWGVFFATDEHGLSRMNCGGVWWCFGPRMDMNGVVFFATDEHGLAGMNCGGVWWCFGPRMDAHGAVFFATDEHGFAGMCRSGCVGGAGSAGSGQVMG